MSHERSVQKEHRNFQEKGNCVHLAPCHHEFRGPRSDYVRQVALATTTEVVNLARQINSEVNSDDVRELLDSDNQELTIDELLEIHNCQVIYSQFGLAIHQNDHQARRRFVEWAQNEIAVVPDFHKRILFSDEAHFWLNGYVNKQNCRIWSEANPQVYVETPLHPEKLTVWCALRAGGILLQKR
ncbi:hypothetical protein TNCV_707431 [Trichonephila clavipes]|nr:hypothetical protein TNCV_707431 [Trichonephila clavipes]